MARKNRPHTPDGRYLVSCGVLKRCTNPALDDIVRRRALKKMMQGRINGDKESVIEAKIQLGEAGPVWWEDGAPDYSNQPPDSTVYRNWWRSLDSQAKAAANAPKKHRRDVSDTVVNRSR